MGRNFWSSSTDNSKFVLKPSPPPNTEFLLVVLATVQQFRWTWRILSRLGLDPVPAQIYVHSVLGVARVRFVPNTGLFVFVGDALKANDAKKLKHWLQQGKPSTCCRSFFSAVVVHRSSQLAIRKELWFFTFQCCCCSYCKAVGYLFETLTFRLNLFAMEVMPFVITNSFVC